jgi:UDP-N-acetylmuramoyl-L-alanyl-D-glutamate--2,6-diaminopimelate ligase
LEAVDRLPGRMERILCGQEFAAFVDAARTPDTLRVCLRAARNVTAGRLICVFGAHGEQQRDERLAIGRVVGAMADVAVVTSNLPRGEDPGAICLQVRNGFASAQRPQVVVHRTAAIAHALDLAQPGDTVVVAGLGEQCHTTLDGDLLMNDADIVRQVLHGTLTKTSPQRQAA